MRVEDNKINCTLSFFWSAESWRRQGDLHLNCPTFDTIDLSSLISPSSLHYLSLTLSLFISFSVAHCSTHSQYLYLRLQSAFSLSLYIYACMSLSHTLTPYPSFYISVLHSVHVITHLLLPLSPLLFFFLHFFSCYLSQSTIKGSRRKYLAVLWSWKCVLRKISWMCKSSPCLVWQIEFACR